MFLSPGMISIEDEEHSEREDRWVSKAVFGMVRSMKKEYDFSRGIRGEFYRPNARLNLPIYLEGDIGEFVEKYGRRKKVDAQTAVNEIFRSNKEMSQALRQSVS